MAETQTQIVHVVVNNQPMLEFDRAKEIPEEQMQYVNDMDKRMDAGVELNGEKIANPDPMQRSQFVANTLVSALYQENYSLAAAMFTWMGVRLPGLKQVQAKGDITTNMKVDLIFDRDYNTSKMEQTVAFHKPDKS